MKIQVRRLLVTLTLLLATKVSAVEVTSTHNEEWQQWPVVGQATLSWLWLDIYSSQLRSPSGEYVQDNDITPHPMALEIHYMRDITNAQFIDATEEQWQNLGYDQQQINSWLLQLGGIFPSVKIGEALVYVTDGRIGKFIYVPNGKDSQQIGQVTDERLNDAFLAIWLSSKTEYQELRQQLIGMNR